MQIFAAAAGLVLLLISTNTYAAKGDAIPGSPKNCPTLLEKLVKTTDEETAIRTQESEQRAEQMLKFISDNMDRIKTDEGQEEVLKGIRETFLKDSTFDHQLLNQKVANFRKMKGIGKELSDTLITTSGQLDEIRNGNSMMGKMTRFFKKQKAQHFDTMAQVFEDMEGTLHKMVEDASVKADLGRQDLAALMTVEKNMEYASMTAEIMAADIEKLIPKLPPNSLQKNFFINLKDALDEVVEIHQTNIATLENGREEGLIGIKLIREGRKVVRTRTLPAIFSLRNKVATQTLLKASEDLLKAHKVVEEATQVLTEQSAKSIENTTTSVIQALSENSVLKPYQKEANARISASQKRLEEFDKDKASKRHARIAALKENIRAQRAINDNTEQKLITSSSVIEPITLSSKDITTVTDQSEK